MTIFAGQYGDNFNIQKSYKDKQSNEWKNTSSLNENDLPAVAEVIRHYFDKVAVLQQSKQQPRQADPYGNQANVQNTFTDNANNNPFA
jgi:hypothetical protein